MKWPTGIAGTGTSIALAAGVALLLATVSAAWFSSGEVVLLKWLPNVAAVILAFSLPGRPLVAVLVGHGLGLSVSDADLLDPTTWLRVHHVLADVLETGLMLAALARITPDGRIDSSSGFIKVAVWVILLPPVLASGLFLFGESLYGRGDWTSSLSWVTASTGAGVVVLVPWLLLRSGLTDGPFLASRTAMLASLALAAAAFLLPISGQTDDDAMVVLLLLMASAGLPLRAGVLLFAGAAVLHDADLRSLAGLQAAASDPSHALRTCVIVIAALYVRLLLADHRVAIARAANESRAREVEAASFERFLDEVDGILWEADATKVNFTFVSAAGERLLGYAPDEWLEPGFWLEHMHPDDRAWSQDYREKEMSAGRSHAFEYRFFRKDGGLVWIRDVVTLRPAAGGGLSLAGVMVDVTASREPLLQLHEANASLDRLAMRHQLALSAGGIGIWEADLDSGESLWDDTMYRLFGTTPDAAQTPRQIMRERLSGESTMRARLALAQARAGEDEEESYAEDYTVQDPSGETRRLRSVVARTVDADGRRKLVGACWDCSLEFFAAEALRVRADELASVLHDQSFSALRARTVAERAEVVQANLVANVSHELRTPLHAILGFIDLAREDLASADPADLARAPWKLERAMLAAKRLLAQVDDLLDLAKLESGATQLRREKVQLPKLLETLEDELGAMLLARSLRLLVSVNGIPTTPASGTQPDMAAEVDELRILQVLRNVLANAVRFSPEGSCIRIDMSLATTDGTPCLRVIIQDEGPGIPDDQLEAVFGKFVQARQSPQERKGGTGLGLPIAREIARAHEGDLRAESSPVGGQFVLTLPIKG